MDKKQDNRPENKSPDGGSKNTGSGQNRRQGNQPYVSKNRQSDQQGGQNAGRQGGKSSQPGGRQPYKHNYSHTNRFKPEKVKAFETADDIRNDIARIEKEIELEIKEIKNMRLGI